MTIDLHAPLQSSSPTNQPICLHCALPIPKARSLSSFCCPGCESVYTFLHELGKESYYELRKELGSRQGIQPKESNSTDFAYLDELPVPSASRTYFQFYLEGVHCSACLWLIEQMPEWVEGLKRVRLNLATKVASVEMGPNVKLSTLAKAFSQLGYHPTLVQNDQEKETLLKKADRLDLIRIAVAGALAGNIMLFSLGVYSGASPEWERFFNWLSFLIALPVVSFCAFPFYQVAYSDTFKRHKFSIDLPISLAIILGISLGGLNLFHSHEAIYFDSITTLVFFLLVSRRFLRKLSEHAYREIQSIRVHEPKTVKKMTSPLDSFPLNCPIESLNLNDLIQVAPGEKIPVDGVIIQGQSFLNYSILTGESAPVLAKKSDFVFAGTDNLSQTLLIQVKATGEETRIGKILSKIQHHSILKVPLVKKMDRVAQTLLLFVLLLGGVLFLIQYPSLGLISASNRFLALLMITCPCGLALATPLALASVISKTSHLGIFVKNADAFERIQKSKNLIFDKTGTLTTGNFQVLKYEANFLHPEFTSETEISHALLSLEHLSKHPVSNAITAYFGKHQAFSLEPVSNFKILKTGGIEGKILGNTWSIQPVTKQDESQRVTFLPQTELTVLKNKKPIAKLTLGDQIRPEAKPLVAFAQDLGFRVYLLSGDTLASTSSVASFVGIPSKNVYAQKSPEEKQAFVQSLPDALMIGDGANDSLALAQANVGIAIRGSIEASLEACDLYIEKNRLDRIEKILKLAQSTDDLTKRNITFSLAYNILGITLAIQGLINPLMAAILMPLSAATVFASSALRTKKLRAILKETA